MAAMIRSTRYAINSPQRPIRRRAWWVRLLEALGVWE